MIEIECNCGYWEVYVDGSLYTYNEDLQTVLEYLSKRAYMIEDLIK